MTSNPSNLTKDEQITKLLIMVNFLSEQVNKLSQDNLRLLDINKNLALNVDQINQTLVGLCIKVKLLEGTSSEKLDESELPLLH